MKNVVQSSQKENIVTDVLMRLQGLACGSILNDVIMTRYGP